ncbi:MAG: carotenoid oxygenase family protein [Gammaproteobacteria bacterium]
MPWRKAPLNAADWLPPERNPLPYAGLISSLFDEHDYECVVDGELPPLDGTLYRIGPGRYDRGPDRKRMVLDGDGMVQALSIVNGRARYRNRYVRTDKYLEEEVAGRFLYPTFSTHGSGSLWRNFGMTLPNQANTTVLDWGGQLLAFDESQRPYELDHDLTTRGEVILDPEIPDLKYWAHWKLDAATEQLHLLALEQGPQMTAHILTLSTSGEIVERQAHKLPRSVYFHDWFVSRNYFAFWLHPAFVDLGAIGRVLIARETFASAIRWRPDQGSVLCVIRRDDGRVWSLPAETCWMWHAINAFDDGDEMVCDFIGSEAGGGLGGEDSALFGIMRGERVSPASERVNFIRRMRVHPERGRVDIDIVSRAADYELPCVSATERALPHSFAYMIQADPGELFARNLCQYDAATGKTSTWHFDDGEYCGEPVFCDAVGGERGRYVISQVYRAADKISDFAVFDEETFASGPVARIQLRHHVPLSFHGYWSPAV